MSESFRRRSKTPQAIKNGEESEKVLPDEPSMETTEATVELKEACKHEQVDETRTEIDEPAEYEPAEENTTVDTVEPCEDNDASVQEKITSEDETTSKETVPKRKPKVLKSINAAK